MESTHRIPAKDVEAAEAQPWNPPVINEAGHLVYAQPRPARREAGNPADLRSADSVAGEDDSKKGYDDGFAKGKAEGVIAGKEEGLRLGKQEAMQAAQLELKPKLAELNKLLTSLSHSLNEEDYKLEQTLLQMVKCIAEAVILREIKIDPAHVMKVIKSCIAALPPSRDNIRVLVNPADKALVDEAINEGGENWRAVADEEISQGGCKIETDQSVADFTIDNRIQTVLDQLYEQQAVCPKPGDPGYEEAPEPAVSARVEATEPGVNDSDSCSDNENEAESQADTASDAGSAPDEEITASPTEPAEQASDDEQENQSDPSN